MVVHVTLSFPMAYYQIYLPIYSSARFAMVTCLMSQDFGAHVSVCSVLSFCDFRLCHKKVTESTHAYSKFHQKCVHAQILVALFLTTDLKSTV